MCKRTCFAAILASVLGIAAAHADMTWVTQFDRDLPLLGHRNWIVVADSAYPLQIADGIETIDTGSALMPVLRTVLASIDRARHVRPVILTDAELPFVEESRANGIRAYRKQLEDALAGRAVSSLPHEAIIDKLAEAGESFKVIVLKTKLDLPYSSVFIQLDCAYWSAEDEAAMRAEMDKARH